jgi:hypothetical protein
MTKKTKELALSKWATTEMDYALYIHLENVRTKFIKLLSLTKMPNRRPPLKEMFLRYDFFLQRGRFFQTQPMPMGYRRGKAQHCYRNSFMLTNTKEGFTYCEGIVVLQFRAGKLIDIEHGWCVTTDKKVIDVTLEKPGLSYFGVPYSPEEMTTIDSVPIIDNIIKSQMEK